MNIALVFAGGSGIRMNSKTKPKQFLELNGKSIIIHTIEHFEFHDEIDGIAVVCIEGWIDYLKDLLIRNNIQKVKWIVEGGATGQESIYKGLNAIYKDCKDPLNTVVLIHDGVRPLISSQLISENIRSVLEFGSAITITSATETIITIESDNKIKAVLDRNTCKLAKAPQSFILNDIWTAHNKAINDKMFNMIDSVSLMLHYGHSLHIVEGSENNIKITTPTDYYIFRALNEALENSQIFGL